MHIEYFIEMRNISFKYYCYYCYYYYYFIIIIIIIIIKLNWEAAWVCDVQLIHITLTRLLRDLDIETPSTRYRVFSKTETFSPNSATIHT